MIDADLALTWVCGSVELQHIEIRNGETTGQCRHSSLNQATVAFRPLGDHLIPGTFADVPILPRVE